MATIDKYATTTSDLTSQLHVHFEAIDADGYAVNGDVQRDGLGVIESSEKFPYWITPGQSVRGSVLVALPSEHGALILKISNGSVEGSSLYGYELPV